MLKSLKYLKYSQKELRNYCNDPNACIKCVEHQLSIGIKPFALGCFREAVTDAVVRIKVGLYDAKLKGFVLDVRNIKVLGNEFAIHNDSPIMHIPLRVDLYVFEPRLNAVVKGIVKHIAHGHISVTIHRVFNVAVRLGGPKHDLNVNDEVSIKLTKFDLNYEIPYIEGVLESPRRSIIFLDSDTNGLAQDSGISTEDSAKDGVRIKKRSRNISSSGTDSDSDASDSKAIQKYEPKAIIKQEPRSVANSSSDSESDTKIPSNGQQMQADESTSSDSDDDDDDNQKTIVSVKKEQLSSDSSSDEATHTNTKAEPNIFSDSDSGSSITPYQKPKRKSTTPPAPEITIKTEELTKNRIERTPPPASPPISTPSFVSKRKRRNSIAPKIDEIISKHIRIKTEEKTPLPTPSPAKTKAKAKKTLSLTTRQTSTLKTKETTTNTPSSSSSVPSKRKRKNSIAPIIDEIISKHIIIKTETTPSGHNTPRKSLPLSASVLSTPKSKKSAAVPPPSSPLKFIEKDLSTTEPNKKQAKKKQIESLVMKVMAHKICKSLPAVTPVKSPSTNDSMTIANASQFESPGLSSTRNEPKSAKKLKTKKQELLSKMLSKF